ncbi:hypothetical protein CWATWH0003_B244 [Crocosphaera watsonii WH 0003]|uniref:Uncharacterized protein n=1 Tax=Crocosphaera watsonii WH 0003 TaxID=423471 RepID=G5JEQ7_CROWT|nr:hypothetical protein CWATWH0003_B244 [Crocosphaera watsonii WH 0003]
MPEGVRETTRPIIRVPAGRAVLPVWLSKSWVTTMLNG